MIRRTFPPHPHQTRHLPQLSLSILDITAKRLENLQSTTGRRNGDFRVWLRLRAGRGRIAQITRCVPRRRQAIAGRGSESEWPVRRVDTVDGGVECEGTGEGHGGDDLGGGEEVHGAEIAVVSGFKVAVERCEDG